MEDQTENGGPFPVLVGTNWNDGVEGEGKVQAALTDILNILHIMH